LTLSQVITGTPNEPSRTEKHNFTCNVLAPFVEYCSDNNNKRLCSRLTALWRYINFDLINIIINNKMN